MAISENCHREQFCCTYNGLIRIYNVMIELLFTCPTTYVGNQNTETSADPPMHK